MTRIRTVLQTEWLALLAMLGLLVLFFPKVATFRECLFIGDILQQFYPYTTYSFERIVKDGELPLWTHQIRMGYPLFAEGQSGILFPTNWLYFLFPPPIAFSCAILSHVLLAAIGTYAFLRSSAAKRPLSRIAALTGAVLYAYSGRLLVSVLDVSDLRVLAALPWCLWALYGLRQKPSLRSMLACACALMLLGLAGKPDVAFQAVAVLLLAAAALIVCREESPPLPRPGARPFVIFFVLAGVLSLVLSAVQWIPTLELLDQSVRRESVPLERWISGSLPPKQILSFVVPWLFGSPYEGTYVGAWSFLFLEMYLGSLGGFLVILGATPAWPRGLGSGRTGSRERLLWLVVAFVGLVLSLGKYLPGYAWLHEVPLLGYGRVPSRWLHVTVFGAAILAAHGMAFLETMLAEGDPDRGAGNRLLLALAAAGLLLLAAAPIAFGPTTDQFPDYALAGSSPRSSAVFSRK